MNELLFVILEFDEQINQYHRKVTEMIIDKYAVIVVFEKKLINAKMKRK